MDIRMIGKILIVLSIIPLAFLVYSLINLESLKIDIFHPRVIVEFLIFIILLSLGLFVNRG
jgi:hypothetical protein